MLSYFYETLCHSADFVKRFAPLVQFLFCVLPYSHRHIAVWCALVCRIFSKFLESCGQCRNVLQWRDVRVLGPNDPSALWVPKVLFREVKRPKREAGHSPPSSAGHNNLLTSTSAPCKLL